MYPPATNPLVPFDMIPLLGPYLPDTNSPKVIASPLLAIVI